MTNQTIYLFLLSFALFTCQSNQETAIQVEEQKKDTDIVVMAYYVPERDYHPENLPLDKLTHIIFSFTKVIDGEMKFRNEEAGNKLKRLVAQKANHPDLKVMVACGGWGADGFSDMALTPESRAKFAKSAVDFIEKYQLDGMDMDWEYPGLPGPGIKFREEDTQNFTLIMKELRERLNTLDRPQTLTFASAGWKRYYNYVETTEVMKYVDFMNIMTYDQVGAKNPYTAHHTALGLITEEDMKPYPYYDFIESRREEMEKRGRKWEPRSAEVMVQFCKELGVDPKQLVIGAAFYGRAWKGVHPKENGLYQKNGGAHIGWAAYHLIRDSFENKNGYQRHWDPIAKAPFLYNPTDSIFISYDDTLSVKLKTQFAIDQNLGGIMFWELGNDTKRENSLMDAIYEVAE